jgi:phospholipid/cholesterol/gamma-HCH transport system substrate-binding protein
MLKMARLEWSVGLFIVLTFAAFMFLAFRVASRESLIGVQNHYMVHASFDDISGLRVRAPVRVAGVRIGQIRDIIIDPDSFRARVTLEIESSDLSLPVDSSASILTEGLLGARYIHLTPGFSPETLKDGSEIIRTNSAMILENMISTFLFNAASKEGEKK